MAVSGYREVIRVFLLTFSKVPYDFNSNSIITPSIFSRGKDAAHSDRNGSCSSCNSKGISLWVFKLVAPVLISFDVMTATAIKLPLILQTGTICTFNSYLQMHSTNLKLIVTTLPKSHSYSFYVKRINQSKPQNNLRVWALKFRAFWNSRLCWLHWITQFQLSTVMDVSSL